MSTMGELSGILMENMTALFDGKEVSAYTECKRDWKIQVKMLIPKQLIGVTAFVHGLYFRGGVYELVEVRAFVP